MIRLLMLLASLLALTGCATPFSPPVFVAGGANFPGLVDLIQKSDGKPVDVVLVHGMCTHDEAWAEGAIDGIVKAVDANLAPSRSPAARAAAAPRPEIRVVTRQVELAGGTVRFSALIWSPLTAGLKQQLTYDNTGEPSDCSTADECKPKRALVNGVLKDVLLNDCLADAMIYQGVSRTTIRDAMVKTLTKLISDGEAMTKAQRIAPGHIMLVSASLGSKVAFDALAHMVEGPVSADTKVAGESAVSRLALVMMGANQLPILGLADQDIGGAGIRAEAERQGDSLATLLKARERQLRASRPGPGAAASTFTDLHLVAFTDPNDLLSYRLQPSRYAAGNLRISDVLVSNDNTYFGLLERPDTAHTRYNANPEVTVRIACGKVKNAACK